MTDRRGQSALTLVELIVAMTLTAMVSGATVGILRGVLGPRERVERQTAVQQEARLAMQALVGALRNAYRGGGNDVLLEGLPSRDNLPADRIRFFTVSRRQIRPGEPESDVRECEFHLGLRRGAGELPALVRRTDPTRNDPPDGGGVEEAVAENVVAMALDYLDGTDWKPSWDASRRDWPAAIRIELVVADPKDRGNVLTCRQIVNFPAVPPDQQQDTSAEPDKQDDSTQGKRPNQPEKEPGSPDGSGPAPGPSDGSGGPR